MRLIKNGFLFLAIVAIVLIAVGTGLLHAQANSPEGVTVGREESRQQRPLTAAVTAIDLNGPVDVVIQQGPVAAMTVRAEQRMLPKITTRQEGDTLHIDTHGLFLGTVRPILVELTLPALQKVAQHGSGDIRIHRFKGDRFELAMHGSGDLQMDGDFKQMVLGVQGSGDLQLQTPSCEQLALTLQGSGNVRVNGSCTALSAQISGSGDLDAGELHSDQVVLTVTGSGDGRVFARRTVKVAIAGSGNVDVRGRPVERSINSTGSGEISFE